MDIGVIAEDHSDIDVLDELTKKFKERNSYKIRRHVMKGCGALIGKCGPAAINLKKAGCKRIVVMHDLDDKNLAQLTRLLRAAMDAAVPNEYLALIPVREVEAWLLCDPSAIRETFTMRSLPKVPASPELVRRPKEMLRDIVYRYSGKVYLNTTHNVRIAARMKLSSLKACKSFVSYRPYIAPVNTKL